MPHFRIYLLTPQFHNQSLYFIKDQISDFYSQTTLAQTRAVNIAPEVFSQYEAVMQLLHITHDQAERQVSQILELLATHYTLGKAIQLIYNIEEGNPLYAQLLNLYQELVFVNQRLKLGYQKHQTFTYSYNEKYTLAQNAQKTLQFDMNRYLTTTNEGRENPFIRNLMVGSVILLQEIRYSHLEYDQFGHLANVIEVPDETLFTVTSIKYDFKENNTIYQIECQDMFTYQTVHENDGYNIVNDPSRTDFIGARTIDGGIKTKIMPECHMNYQYLPMQTGLYITKQGHYRTFTYNEYANLQIPNNEEILKIIKEPYSPDKDPDYFNTFSFSCSNSNANAALISLADLIDFQVVSFEHQRINGLTLNEIEKKEDYLNIYDQFFWVEPKQNDKRLGLEYTPTQSIKSFSLTHTGNSLTTVLNVEGPTIEEEIITLLPTLPPFFANYFLSGANGDNSKLVPGYFTNLCQGRLYISNDLAHADAQALTFRIALTRHPNSTASSPFMNAEYVIHNNLFYLEQIPYSWCSYDDDGHYYYYFPLYTDDQLLNNYLFDIPTIYNQVCFNNDINESTILFHAGDNPTVMLSNKISRGELVINDLDTESIHVLAEHTETQGYATHKYRAFLRIQVSNFVALDDVGSSPNLYLRFSRAATANELEFAKIADACPGLENKLVNFTYFYNNRILTNKEYQELMNIFNNQLRIVNGKLMVYAQAYYQALHQETTILANLQNQLDLLGAECQASIIDPCTTTAQPKLDLKKFIEIYQDVTQYQNTQSTAILNHTQILEEYFNKYFNSQQRFLKNIKNFRDYFEAPVNFAIERLYSYQFQMAQPNFADIIIAQHYDGKEKHTYSIEIPYYSFNTIQMKKVSTDFSLYIGYQNNSILDEDRTINNYGLPQVPLYRYDKDSGYTLIETISKQNYQDYYIIPSAQKIRCQASDVYVNQRLYKEQILKVPVIKSGEYGYYLTPLNRALGCTQDITKNVEAPLPWIALYRLHTNDLDIYCAGYEIQVVNATQGYLCLHAVDATEGPENNVDNGRLDLIYYNSSNDQMEQEASGSISAVVVDYRLLTTSEIKNRGIANLAGQYGRNHNNNSIQEYYYHKTPIYRQVSAVPTGFTNHASDVLMLTYLNFNFAAYWTGGVTIHSGDYDTDKINDTQLYTDNFPIQTYYYYGPVYSSTTNNGITYFKRYNRNGEDQKQYFQILQKHQIVENPYNFNDYQAIPAIHQDNVTNYYHRILFNANNPTGKSANNVPIALYLGPQEQNPQPNLGTDTINNFAQTGVSTLDWFNNNGVAIYSDYSRSTKILYGKTAASYLEYQEQLATILEKNSSETEYNIEANTGTDEYYRYIAKDVTQNYITILNRTPLISPEVGTNPLFYFLIGSKIGVTYYTAQDLGLFYQTQGACPLAPNDLIIANTCYKILEYGDDNYNNQSIVYEDGLSYGEAYAAGANALYQACLANIGENLPIGFDTIAYYPLTNLMIPVDLTRVDGNKQTTYSVKALFQEAGYINDAGKTLAPAVDFYDADHHCYRIRMKENGYLHYFSLFRIQDHLPQSLDTQYQEILKHFNWDGLASTDSIYNNQDVECDWQKGPQLVQNLFYDEENVAPVQINTLSSIPDFDPTETYYNAEQKRIYTLYQLMYGQPYEVYYVDGSQYKEELFSDQVRTFTPSLYLNKALINYTMQSHTDENEQIVGDLNSCVITKIQSALDDSINELVFDQDANYATLENTRQTIQLTITPVNMTSPLTNGAFGYQYHNCIEHPTLLQQAVVIETQLSEYWQSAYLASQYCEFFLPEHWQPVYDTKINMLASRIFNTVKIEDSLSLKINSDYIPIVEVVTDDMGNTRLDKYQFKRTKYAKLQTAEPNGGYIDQLNTYLAQDYLAQNNAIINVMNNLDERLANGSIEKIGKTTYYYAKPSTGYTGAQFLLEATSQRFDLYSGQYILLYRLLKKRYNELSMSEYYKYQEQHDHLWNIIFHKYQFLLFQNSYKNENATTSEELLQMAQYAFKNLAIPEADYSISVINAAELKGYYGQEIRIGDGIRVKAQDYYNEYDQIYNSLSQYLFVSQISYSLRNPLDISLTVNDVQYTDKIVQRLVKLLK